MHSLVMDIVAVSVIAALTTLLYAALHSVFFGDVDDL